MTVFIKGLVDGRIKTNLFRFESEMLDEKICVSEQEKLGLGYTEGHSSYYLTARRQEVGG